MTKRNQSTQTSRQEYSLRSEVLFLVTIAALCSFLSFGGFVAPKADAAVATSSVPALSYSCPVSGIHCYGYNYWPGAVDGASTEISVRGMSGGDGFVNNEMWVDQYSNSGYCGSFGGGLCWVEGGYASGDSNNGASEFFFWANELPTGGNQGYYEVDSPTLQSGDYGHTVTVQIFRLDSSNWQANVDGAVTVLSGDSYLHAANANDIKIGQELAGTSGANAPTAHFTFNYWADTTTGAFHKQTVDGTLDPCCTSHNPPWAGWTSGLDPVHNPGGDFYTCTLPSSGGNPC